MDTTDPSSSATESNQFLLHQLIDQANNCPVDTNCLHPLLDTLLLTHHLQLNNLTFRLSLYRNAGHLLIPALLNLASEKGTATPLISNKALSALALLTSPVECLSLGMRDQPVTDIDDAVKEIQEFLQRVKGLFSDGQQHTHSLMTILQGAAVTTLDQSPSDPATHSRISSSLLLLRNILHINEKDDSGTLHRQFLCNLFAHSIDKTLLTLINSKQSHLWAVLIVQIIALFYKDHHPTSLHLPLATWPEETSTMTSSEDFSDGIDEDDDESNTSPADRQSPMLPSSDPATSDSSDNAHVMQAGRTEEEPTRTQKKVCPTTKPPTTTDIVVKVYTKTKSKEKLKKEKSSDVESGISSLYHFEGGDNLNNCVMEDNKICGQHASRPNQEESTTTSSSNEEDQQQHMRGVSGSQTRTVIGPFLTTTPQDTTSDLKRRKKLHKRANKKGRPPPFIPTSSSPHPHHHPLLSPPIIAPSPSDVPHLLHHFTIDWLLSHSYSSLVTTLSDPMTLPLLDFSHLLWLITYFLKFASQMELISLDHVAPVLSSKILSYLIFQGVDVCENLAVVAKEEDVKPHLRRMHLVVTAVGEFVNAVGSYSSDLEGGDQLRDLHPLFPLLLRHYTPGLHSKQYLRDLVVTNHALLLLLEKGVFPNDILNLTPFLDEFSSPVIMQQYGHLLEDFQTNGEHVNDCVFTIMHHIAGDLGRPEALFLPSILKTFSTIWEVKEFPVKDDWADLVEYVTHRFLKASDEEKASVFTHDDSTRCCCQCQRQCNDYCGCDDDGITSSRSSSSHATAGSSPHSSSMSRTSSIDEGGDFATPTTTTTAQEGTLDDVEDPSRAHYMESEVDTAALITRITASGEHLTWLQNQILEACYVKWGMEVDKVGLLDNMSPPIPYHYMRLNQSVPIIPWTHVQELFLHCPLHLLLLRRLGLQLPLGKLFPRIPHFLNASVLLSIAKVIGPLPRTLKVDVGKVVGVESDEMPPISN